VSASTTAKTYAGVLLDIGREKNTLDVFLEELAAFSDIIYTEEQFRTFLSMPGIGKAEKKAFLNKTLSGNISGDFMSFLCVLVDNDRQSEIRDIESAYRVLLDEEKKSARVTVVTSVPIDDALRSRISLEMGKRYDRKIILEERIDPSILGGVILKSGDTVIDGSVLTRLRAIKEKLLLSNIRGEAVYED
jgi:F-type H+-transporting ATPase subunit delta